MKIRPLHTDEQKYTYKTKYADRGTDRKYRLSSWRLRIRAKSSFPLGLTTGGI